MSGVGAVILDETLDEIISSRPSPSHFPLGESEGVKSWAVSGAECSLIHVRLLNNQNELEQKSCDSRRTNVLREHNANQM